MYVLLTFVHFSKSLKYLKKGPTPISMESEKIYLDSNATTIVDPLVRDAMQPFYSEMYGNPNSLHVYGTEVHPYMKIAFDRLYAGINAND